MKLILIWALNAVALLLVPYLIPGVHMDTFLSALIAVLVLGFAVAVLLVW